MYSTSNNFRGFGDLLMPGTQKVYTNVNYNAKSSDGSYPCRTKPCYSIAMVDKVLKAYADCPYMYIPSQDGNIRAEVVTDVCQRSGYIKMAETNQVEAILYENFYVSGESNLVTTGTAAKKSAPAPAVTDSTKTPAYTPKTVSQADFAAPSIFSTKNLLIGGAVVVVAWILLKKK